MIRYAVWLLSCLFSLMLTACGQQPAAQPPAHTNALIHQTSPYLLQHAHNPVNWHPWGEEALKEAKEENKLMIISIGYAACHWCHVMEHESFEDSAVAALMNKHFVSIKVDREERPDVDQVYMDAAQLMTGRGGWPLNAIALPDGRPVFAGTYFPKKEWMNVLSQVQRAYENNPDRLEKIAQEVTQGIQSMEAAYTSPTSQEYQPDMLDELFRAFKPTLDFQRGGRQGAPKFPMPVNQEWLMQYYYYTGNTEAREAVLTTLNEMMQGGLYDHLGGGFARYSTDAQWRVPHFEKMLYDNAQLVSLYSHAYQLTHDPRYRQVVYETLNFITREMTSPEGAFYSSLDADSEGEEGKFYVWTTDQVDSLKSDSSSANPVQSLHCNDCTAHRDSVQSLHCNDCTAHRDSVQSLHCNDTEGSQKLLKQYYHITPRGNWEDGKNILYTDQTDSAFAQENDTALSDWLAIKQAGKQCLFHTRAQRVRPGLDDKSLTAWNALMLNGYVDAYRTFGEERFLQAALKNAQLLQAKVMQSDSSLMRNYKDGKATIDGFLDDYSFTVAAFINLYQATFDEQWLYAAQRLQEYALHHFNDPSSALFFYTSDRHPSLIARKKEVSDNVIPASNSQMAINLHQLGLLLYREDYLETSRAMLDQVYPSLLSSPGFYAHWGVLLNDFVHEPYEVAIVGLEYQAKRQALDQHYLPNALLLGGATEGTLELLEDKQTEGQTMIYVCQDKMCLLPVEAVDKAVAQILP